MRKLCATVVCVCLSALSVGAQVEAQVPIPVGAIGDSTADSYRANDNRGGNYKPVTFNWLEILVRTGRVDAGTWATYSEPRRIDYARNWARSGATSYTVISAGQHTGLAAQVVPSGVEFVVVTFGANDFHYNSSYKPVYDGTLSGAALQTKINTLAQKKILAVQTVVTAGTNAVVLPSGDYGQSPAVMAMFPDPVKRARVTAAIQAINVQVQTAFASNPAVVVITSAEANAIIPGPTFVYGGVTMNCTVQGDAPTFCILKDKHAGTVISGLMANLIIGKVNAAFGLGIVPLTTYEVLHLAGLQ